MTFGSLFAGIGGIDLGLERAGMRCLWQVEKDEFCQRVLAKHWPEVKRYGDITTVDGSELQPVDLIAGGFPCQDISYAGRGAGLDGERSGLFFEVVRLVRQCKPRFVLLENVAALLVRGMDRVCGELAQIGYDAEWHCIPAASVGAPHIRDRVFALAYPNSKWQSQPQGVECNVRRWLGNGCQEIHNVADARRQYGESGDIRQPVGDEATIGTPQAKDFERCGKSILAKFRDTIGRAQWAVEPAVGRVANGVPRRMDRLRGLGNAVVPQIAEWIGRQLMQKEPTA